MKYVSLHISFWPFVLPIILLLGFLEIVVADFKNLLCFLSFFLLGHRYQTRLPVLGLWIHVYVQLLIQEIISIVYLLPYPISSSILSFYLGFVGLHKIFLTVSTNHFGIYYSAIKR